MVKILVMITMNCQT